VNAFPLYLPVTYLTGGSHDSPEEGLCLIEAAAHHAGEPHSDHAECVCPVLAAFGRTLNDGPWPSDEARTEALGPLVALLAGTRSTPAVEQRRAALLAQRALTVYAPLALYAAVCSLENCGIDCQGLRKAALALCEWPCRETATAAAAAAASAYAVRAAARDAAAAASAYAVRDAAADAAYAVRAAARAAASTASYAVSAAASAAAAAAYAVSDAASAAASADASASDAHADASTASGGLTVLCLAADDLRAACEITEATL